jgi:predicted Zn-ribbon and HTH transcriptional regulator
MSKRMEKWITSLIDSLDKSIDEKTRVEIFEQCGRRCQSQSFVKKTRKIRQQSKSDNEFIEKLSQVYKHLHREGDSIYITYPRCYCSFVNKIPPRELSKTWCNCSRGWAKELFEGALDRSVEVVLEKSIVRGDDQCRFRILL